MDEFDALGRRKERHEAFTAGLLSEADDAELTSFVEEAAADLGAPMAMVTLVLERIQLFKAHCGLPADLAAARATERDVSFCQFVVRDGEPFEVVDAEQDERIPQALVKRYGLGAYLGIPVRVNDTVVGSLCVLDTKAREFSDEQRAQLKALALRASARLEQLAKQREAASRSLPHQAAGPGLAELRLSLEPIRGGAASARIASATIRSVLGLVSFAHDGGSTAPGALTGALEQSQLALEDLEDALVEIDLGSSDIDDCAQAVESVLGPDAEANLSQVLGCAQDLSRSPCRRIGGAPLPDLSTDPLLAAPRAIAVTLVSAVLNQLSDRMNVLGLSDGIKLEIETTPSQVVISFSSPELPARAYEEAHDEIIANSRRDPTVTLKVGPGAIRVSLGVVQRASH